MDFFDLPLTEQRAAIQREKHAGLTCAVAEAQREIGLLRAALYARQAATPHAQMTAAEIRWRAFEQARAARGLANGLERIGSTRKAKEWREIARDFERAGQHR